MSESIEKLKAWQLEKRYHPFTCGNNRTDEKHLDGEGVLVPTEDGWICPYCDYKQPYRAFEKLLMGFLF